MEYLGNQCYICGITGHQSMFDTHHVNPKLKEFSPSKSLVRWENLIKELDKCVLLCANCHSELHFGLFELLPIKVVGDPRFELGTPGLFGGAKAPDG